MDEPRPGARARHRLPDPPPAEVAASPYVHGVLRRNVLLLAAANTSAAAAMGFFPPGTSPSLAFLAIIAPLPVWAAGFAAAAAFQIANRPLIGHSIAAPLWVMLAAGAVLGLLNGASQAPAASLLLAGLEMYTAGLQVNAMAFRRREREARRAS